MVELSNRSNQGLVRLIADGNLGAESMLFQRLDVVENIRRQVSFCSDFRRDDQDDIVCEALLAVLTSLRKGKYNPEHGSIKGYIYGVTRNVIKNYRRRVLRHVTVSLEQVDASVNPVESDLTAASPSLSPLVMLKSLHQRYQLLLFMRFVENLSIADMSEMLDLTPMQIYGKIAYAIKLLQFRFGKLQPQF